MDASISSSQLLSAIREGRSPLVIDVRRKPPFRAATDMIAGALWRDPERVADWAGELPRASRVVAYCGHGRESSQGVAKALAERGIGAQYLQGRQDEVHTWNPAAYRWRREPVRAPNVPEGK